MRHPIFEQLHKGLIVSCQALEGEPLFGASHMAKMAKAAEMGGAAAIRANSAGDVRAIRAETKLPVIGLVKRDYPDSEVYITPTAKEVDELLEAGADIIAVDATGRPRPDGGTLEDLVSYMKSRDAVIMADISTLAEAVYAAALGVDCVSTTMSGYTGYSPQLTEPDFGLVRGAALQLSVPVIAEGRISDPAQAVKALEEGAFAVVVGTAITRPQVITSRYVDQIRKAVDRNGFESAHF
ncbi:N-acetylmannosamine-6-phosphate 2-epimerase [Paenibacillus gansuensis]|uniref:Putative N-acetylmannosamine-6-phosphate 2-epimerase n=1 Tax=Paenibacillus gansuensis TaxID=306542 RepID=A0ABW5PJ96_9BACL